MIILNTTNARKGLSVTKTYDSVEEAIDLAKEYAEDEDVHVTVCRMDNPRQPWRATTLFEANTPE